MQKGWVKINGELVSLNKVRIITDVYAVMAKQFPDAVDSDQLSFDIIYEDKTEYQVKFPESVEKEWDEKIIISKLQQVRNNLLEILDAVNTKEIVNVSN